MRNSVSTTGQVDWSTGIWQRSPSEKPSAEIIIAGDWAPIREFSEPMLDKPAALYGDLLPELRNSHLRLVNLECPLIDYGEPVHKSGAVLKGVPAHISGLSVVPFDGVTLGNNHIFDYGNEAFFRTLRLLDRTGIRYTGAGRSATEAEEPLRVTVNGVDIGVISFSEGEDLTAAAEGKPGVFGWNEDRVVDLVKALRADVHVVVVVCHAGVEYIPFPPPYLAETLRRVADAGADLVIGHHPHVPQGIEIRAGVPICYSLGNFVFYQPTNLQYRKIGYLVKAGVATDGLRSIRIIPYEIVPGGLMRLRGENRRRLFKQLEALSAPLTRAAGLVDAWHGFLKYYGIDGFKKEIAAIMDRLEYDPPKGAAMFRNRLTTLQHYHHLKDLMTCIVEDTLDIAPQWAVAFVADYFTRTVTEGLPE